MTLTERRRAKDLSLGECARACRLGSSTLSQIERGAMLPPDAVLGDIAQVLGCSIEDVRSGLPSPEETAEIQKRAADSVNALAAVMRDMGAHGFGKGKPGRGEIECPACHKRLAYRVAEDGHTFGVCETDGCVRWME